LVEGAVHDISRRKFLEAQLQQAQKMEAIGRLAGGVAHDFNNALSVMMGYSELVQLGLKPDDPLQSKLEEILKAADRAALADSLKRARPDVTMYVRLHSRLGDAARDPRDRIRTPAETLSASIHC